MIETEAKLRKWGRSMGIVIPMETVREANLSEGEVIGLRIFNRKNPLKETFGKLKFKKSTEELLREVDKEAWDE